jgi:hypothetical protein
MPLNDLAIKRAQPGAKIIKLSDGSGLQLWITPDGAKRWRMAYRLGGVQKTLAIGVYPYIGLKEAREATGSRSQDLGARARPFSGKARGQSSESRKGREYVCDHRVGIDRKEAAGREGGGHAEKIRMVHELRFSGARRPRD